MLAGDIEMNPGPRFQCRRCKKYCKTSDKAVECEDCKKRFHATCSELGNEVFEKLNQELILAIAQTAKRITKTCLYNFDHETPLLYSKTGFYRGLHYFSYFCIKYRLWVLVRTASARRF